MSTNRRRSPRLPLVLLLLGALASAPAVLGAQQEPGPESLEDLPLSAAQRLPFVGTYSLRAPRPDAPPLSLQVFEYEGALLGSMDGNDPTRLLYQGAGVFRPQDAPVFVLTFAIEDGRATRVSIESPEGPMEGVRVDERDRPDPAAHGVLFEELERMDQAMFAATYVDCDAAAANALFTENVEFYHDRNGARSGQEVLESFAALAASCPRDRGVTRELVAGSLRVYPMDGYGAVQTGMHRFREEGSPMRTTARFVHLWRRTPDGWRLARALSFDHRREPDIEDAVRR